MYVEEEGASRSRRAARLPAGRGYGRFLEADPIGYADGPNWYAYAGNDPVNATDPSGLKIAHETIPTVGGSGGVTHTGSILPGVIPNGLQINGIDAQAAQMGQANAVEGALPAGTSDGIIRATVTCINTPGCVSAALAGGSHAFSVPTYTDPGTGDIVVTGKAEISDGSRWVLVGDRYVENPNYVTPWYDIGIDGIVQVETMAYSGAEIGVVLKALPTAMAVSDSLGLQSSRFGNKYYLGKQGSWNFGLTRLGWSFKQEAGIIYFQPRIGGYHVPSPIGVIPW